MPLSKTVSTMSSATSTEQAGSKPDDTLQPWQFFVLAALGCATAVTFFARGRGLTPVILLSVLMGVAALVGLAALRAVRPLVSPREDRTSMIGRRTRAALEREKLLTLRAIKELEFDRAMGKLSESDWQEMSGRLRKRAAGIIRQLDSGSGYREQIERDLASRLGAVARVTPDTTRAAPDPKGQAYVPGAAHVRGADLTGPPDANTCAACATTNDPDARFCKNCGTKL